MAQKRLTKEAIRRQMTRIERSTGLGALQAGAQMLGQSIEVGSDGTLRYCDESFADRDALVDELLVDLGNKARSL